MGTILESTKELSKKLGVEAEEQTIKDQIDAINESIDENFGGSIDIAEAVKTYSENASGGGGESNFSRIVAPFMSYSETNYLNLGIFRSEDGNYSLSGIDRITRFIFVDPVKKAIVYQPSTDIIFTPAEDFDGFYTTEGRKLSLSGDEIVNGDGKTYKLYTDVTGNTVKKFDNDFTVTIE